MTKSDLVSRAMDNLSTPRPQLDPITLTILLAILTTVVEHLTEKCLDRLDAKAIRSPGPIARWRLWRLVQAAEVSPVAGFTQPMVQDPTLRKRANQLAYDALLKAAAGLIDAELATFVWSGV